MHPLRNITAVRTEDPVVRQRLVYAMRQDHAREVWERGSWVLSHVPLPGTAAVPAVLEELGLLVAQGEDRLGATPELVGRRIAADLAAGGHAAVRDIPGDLTLLSLAEDTLCLVRSISGLVPWFVHERPGYVVVATLMSEIVRWSEQRPDIDPLVCAMWAHGLQSFPDDRTVLGGVSAVQRGHLVRIADGRVRSPVPWWDPPASPAGPPGPAVVQEHVARLRAALLEEVERDLDPDGTNLLAVSGGVDSSCLVALASRTFGARVAGVTVQSYRMPQDQAYERAYVAALLNEVTVTPHHVLEPLGGQWPALLRSAPRSLIPVTHPVLAALPGLTSGTDVHVYMGGEMADEVIGSEHTLPEWALAHSPLWLLRNPAPGGRRRSLQHWGRSLSARARRRYPRSWVWARQLSPLFREELREEYVEWLHRTERRPRYDSRRATTLDCIAMDGFVAMNWEVASALNVRRSMPFMSRDVLEIGLSCHPTELLGPHTKVILRRAMAGLVPSHNLERQTKGTGPQEDQTPEDPIPWDVRPLEGTDRVLRSQLLAGPVRLTPTDASRLAVLEGFLASWNHPPSGAQE